MSEISRTQENFPVAARSGAPLGVDMSDRSIRTTFTSNSNSDVPPAFPCVCVDESQRTQPDRRDNVTDFIREMREGITRRAQESAESLAPIVNRLLRGDTLSSAQNNYLRDTMQELMADGGHLSMQALQDALNEGLPPDMQISINMSNFSRGRRQAGETIGITWAGRESDPPLWQGRVNWDVPEPQYVPPREIPPRSL